ncbi:hypothetical protein OROHE_014795 [Orobanche hederae]
MTATRLLPGFLDKKMEMDQGRLFIGGIAWDTNEDRLKEYFGAYGEVVEAVIMRDRTTGRARGFGFVVFSNPTDAERVIKEKHTIDGRTVEAKKAVPRDDQHLISRNSGSTQGSREPGRTKKIFVGGLSSTVTESGFKSYFDQFGTIMDVVVMYDHNTQRPRGFGFITYDSEDAVDMVLQKTFHELNGKMVEVKRAVPKELSPGPSRVGPHVGYNYGFGCPAYGMGLNMEQGSNFSSNLPYSRILSPYFGSNQSRYNMPIGYNASASRGDSFLTSSSRNVWGNGGGLNSSANIAGSSSYFGSVGGGFGMFRNNGVNWDTSLIAPSLGGSLSGHDGANFGNRGGENSYALGTGGGFRRSNVAGVTIASSFTASSGDYEGSCGDFYLGGSVYGDPTWKNTSSQLDNNGSFGYFLGYSEDIAAKDSKDYVVGYDIASRKSE